MHHIAFCNYEIENGVLYQTVEVSRLLQCCDKNKAYVDVLLDLAKVSALK